MMTDKEPLPVYRHPAAYAAEHDQLDQYRSSRKANMACKDAIEAAICENYRNARLDHAAAENVVNRFGMERVAYVLSVTIRDKDWDGRISRENKAWAQTIPVQENRDTWGQDRNLDFVITQAHPGLIDLFASQVRRLDAERKNERPSVMRALQKQAPAPLPAKKGKGQER